MVWSGFQQQDFAGRILRQPGRQDRSRRTSPNNYGVNHYWAALFDSRSPLMKASRAFSPSPMRFNS